MIKRTTFFLAALILFTSVYAHSAYSTDLNQWVSRGVVSEIYTLDTETPVVMFVLSRNDDFKIECYLSGIKAEVFLSNIAEDIPIILVGKLKMRNGRIICNVSEWSRAVKVVAAKIRE